MTIKSTKRMTTSRILACYQNKKTPDFARTQQFAMDTSPRGHRGIRAGIARSNRDSNASAVNYFRCAHLQRKALMALCFATNSSIAPRRISCLVWRWSMPSFANQRPRKNLSCGLGSNPPSPPEFSNISIHNPTNRPPCSLTWPVSAGNLNLIQYQ